MKDLVDSRLSLSQQLAITAAKANQILGLTYRGITCRCSLDHPTQLLSGYSWSTVFVFGPHNKKEMQVDERGFKGGP